MPLITAIKPQKSHFRQTQRFNVFLDGKFGFALSAEALVKTGLKINQEISPEEIKELKKKDVDTKLYNQALHFLSYRPRSEKEIKDYLRKKGVGLKTSAKIIQKLKKLDLIDDRAFTAWWIEQRARFRPKGKQMLRQELWQKGIDREIAEATLFPDEKELVLAKKASRKKLDLWQNLGWQQRRQKITAFLAQRGFSWPTIKKVLEENEKKQ